MSGAPGQRHGGSGRLFAAALVGVLAGALLVGLWQTFRDPGRAEMEGVVRDYVLANPEIIPEAMERLHEREATAAVEANRAAIETPFEGAWAGAERGDVVLVEFFDYACGYCRASNPDVERLLAEDPGLKVVWRELPVLGPASRDAAYASLAAARGGPDRFRAFYDALFARGRPTGENVAAAARAAGIDPASVPEPGAAPDFENELQQNIELAGAIGASGTPTFVVGDRVLQGAVGYRALKDAVEEARRN